MDRFAALTPAAIVPSVRLLRTPRCGAGRRRHGTGAEDRPRYRRGALRDQGRNKSGVTAGPPFRPFDAAACSLFPSGGTVNAIAVALAQTKEPARRRNLFFFFLMYWIMVANTGQAVARKNAFSARVVGGRYGMSSEGFLAGPGEGPVFDELRKEDCRDRITLGIDDDVRTPSLGRRSAFVRSIQPIWSCAVFYGLGPWGNGRRANKNTVKIMPEWIAGLAWPRLFRLRLAQKVPGGGRTISPSAFR